MEEDGGVGGKWMKMEGYEESGGRWRGRRKVDEDGGVGGKWRKMEG